MKAPRDRVILQVDLEYKKSYRFADGTTIRLERGWNNLNKRETESVNGIVVHGGDIPAGSEILFHHNATHPTNELFSAKALSGKAIASNIKTYSVPIAMCFLYRHEDQWLPLKGFATALRVFRPVESMLIGMEPKLIKDTLYITSGKDKGLVFTTVRASDYQIVFQGMDGREGNLIRCRHYEDEENDLEELIAINHELTEKVKNGRIKVGLTPTDAKYLLEPCLT